MKSKTFSENIETRLGGIWAILLALCLNPWLVARLLTADGRFESGKVSLVLSFITAVLLLLSYFTLTKKIRLAAVVSKTLLMLASGLLSLYLTIFLDRLIGKILLPPTQNLIFPANSEVKYVTPEFKVTAQINSLGFRDEEYSLAKGKKFRVVIIGDSFTFGWGVNLQDTWVKHLEKKFNNIYSDIEVLNLGRSGASPETYEAIAARVVPVLQPDLVIIALLQGNDLQQLLPTDASGIVLAPTPQFTFKRLLNITTANAYPNIFRLFAARALQTEVKPIWQEQATTITRLLTPEQQLRFTRIDPKARS